eukprot:jgi/Ulvmu1/10049/UM059_0099.1
MDAGTCVTRRCRATQAALGVPLFAGEQSRAEHSCAIAFARAAGDACTQSLRASALLKVDPLACLLQRLKLECDDTLQMIHSPARIIVSPFKTMSLHFKHRATVRLQVMRICS